MTDELWVIATGDQLGTLIAEAHRLADRLETTGDRPTVLAVGFGADGLPERTVRPDDAAVLVPTDAEFGSGATAVRPRVDALAWLARNRSPRVVLAEHTPDGDDIVSRLGTRLGGSCVTGCLVRIREDELLAGRPAYEGRAYAEFNCDPPAVLSVDTEPLDTPRSTQPLPEPTQYETPIEATNPNMKQGEVLSIPEQDLSRARRVVAGGRGLGGPAGFEPIRELQAALGATLGASRPPADDGWVAYDRQIGVTGTAIDPELYVACAISGDPYHLRSVSAEHLIAINTDPDARIFDVANLGIVGDATEIAPAIADAVSEEAGE